MKTGSTGLALYNLSASATRDNLSLIAVIMKAPSTKIRFSEAQRLLDYGFSTFSFKELGKKGDVIKNISVSKGKESEVQAVLKTNSNCLLKKGQESKIEQNIDLPETITAPVKAGQKVGEVHFSIDGENISNADIVAKNDIEKNTFISIYKKVLSFFNKIFKK